MTRRRDFLLSSLAFAGSSAFMRGFAIASQARFASNPFTLGVASGYPSPESVVLWTRLAPAPLEPGSSRGTLRLSRRNPLQRLTPFLPDFV